MRLSEIIKELRDYKLYNFKDFDIKGVSCDSRKIKNGFIFVAIKGEKYDGHSFISEAIRKGARVIVSKFLPKSNMRKDITYLQVKDTRKAYSHICAEFYQHPSKSLRVIGVTGTNGKTTVTYLLEKILNVENKDSLLIGTIDYHYKDKSFVSHNTTPSCEEIQYFLSQAKNEGVKYAIMEVSSHALDQERVRDVDFSYAIFTNFSQDHLDYHRTMSAYFNAKAKLFRMLKPYAKAIINLDDPYGRKLFRITDAQILTYGLNRYADISAQNIRFSNDGTYFILITPQGKVKIKSPLIGGYNVYNILAGVSFAILENIELKSIKEAIENFSPPKGRLEKVYAKDFFIYVDYAHTPVALKNVLLSLRKIFKKKIILVFGCGGERDKDKRPKMGRIATELADFVIITSDNPRNEDPLEIIKDILKGVKKKNYLVIPERKEAIFKAISLANKGDLVLIAGKGHENYQLIKDRIIPFNDCEVIREYFKS